MTKADASGSDTALRPIDDEVLRVLVTNHKRFRSFLVRRLGNETVADDILQMSFRKAVEQPATSKSEESVLAWFFRILRNAVIDHYRAKDAENRKLREFKSAVEADQKALFQEMQAEVCACMKELLPTLKPEYGELLARIDLGEESADAVAASLGITRGNLDVRLHRARSALKKSLQSACGTCTEHGCLNCSCG